MLASAALHLSSKGRARSSQCFKPKGAGTLVDSTETWKEELEEGEKGPPPPHYDSPLTSIWTSSNCHEE